MIGALGGGRYVISAVPKLNLCVTTTSHYDDPPVGVITIEHTPLKDKFDIFSDNLSLSRRIRFFQREAKFQFSSCV